jgi:hypothetical protein
VFSPKAGFDVFIKGMVFLSRTRAEIARLALLRFARLFYQFRPRMGEKDSSARRRETPLRHTPGAQFAAIGICAQMIFQ